MQFSDDYQATLINAARFHEELEQLGVASMTLTIADVTRRDLDNDPRSKWILGFLDYGSEAKVNPTNGQLLRNMFGNDSEGWIGRQVELSTRYGAINDRGDQGHMLVMKPLNTPALPVPKKQNSGDNYAAASGAKNLDDPIPF